MSDENVLCTHQLLIRFDQLDDGTVTWYVVPDDRIGQTRTLGLFGMAACGAPLAALGIRALWKLCEDGLVFHALEEANGVQAAVNRRLLTGRFTKFSRRIRLDVAVHCT